MECNIIHGNCLDVMKKMDANSVDSIVTDPPYGISFMGKKWDYDVPNVEIWKECLRILKPGGYLLAFAGTKTQHRMAVNVEDAGFEIRDMIAWVYGSGFPKSLNVGKAVDQLCGSKREIVCKKQRAKKDFKDNLYAQDPSNKNNKKVFGYGEEIVTKGTSEYEGWGTTLKPALEPITVARKPLSEKTVAKNCLKWGTGGINIDGCRVEYQGLADKESAIPQGRIKTKVEDFAGRTQGGGKDNELDRDKRKEKMSGRFPANLIHDGSDEVVILFPNSKGASSQNNFSNGNIYRGQLFQNSKTILEGCRDWYNDNGSAARFFYCAKTSKKERNMGCENLPTKNNHPTVKPVDLMRYLCRLVTPKNGIVLDPFCGSGSTLIGAHLEGFEYIGIELEKEYVEIAKNRLSSLQRSK